MLSRRVGGLAGLAFLVLVGSANIILGVAGQPTPGASPAEVNEFFANSGAAVGAASSVATLVWICLALFAAGIVARLRQKAPDRVESWPLLGLGAAFMQNTIFSMVVACQIVLSTADLSSESASALWQLHNALFTLNGTSLALVLLSFSIAGLRAGLIRRWHGTLGLVAAATLALSSFLTPDPHRRRPAGPARSGRLPDVAGLDRHLQHHPPARGPRRGGNSGTSPGSRSGGRPRLKPRWQ